MQKLNKQDIIDICMAALFLEPEAAEICRPASI